MLRLKSLRISPDQPEPNSANAATGGSFQKDRDDTQDPRISTVSIRDTSSNSKLDSFKCSSCGKNFSDPSELFTHKRDTHLLRRITLPLGTVERYFDYPNRRFCPICKKSIRSKGYRSIFVKHVLTHTAGLKYKCTVCKKEFTRKDHMKVHEKRHIIPLQNVRCSQEDQVNYSMVKRELHVV